MARVKDPWSLWEKSLFLCLSGKWRLIGVLYRRRWYAWFLYIYMYTFIEYILSWAITMYLELALRLWSFASTLSTAKRCFRKRCRKIGDWNESNVVIGVLVTETLVLTGQDKSLPPIGVDVCRNGRYEIVPIGEILWWEDQGSLKSHELLLLIWLHVTCSFIYEHSTRKMGGLKTEAQSNVHPSLSTILYPVISHRPPADHGKWPKT